MSQKSFFNYRTLLAGLLLIMLAPLVASAQKTDNSSVIYFDLNVPTLNAAAKHTVDALLSGHKINKNQKLLLYGYADYLGSRAHNDSLSTDRAMNVRAYLVGKGIPESNITICVGKGAIDREPKTDHTGYAKDRKVEIITDEAKMKSLTCRPMAKFEPLAWSKNVNQLNVHATSVPSDRKLTDNTVSVTLPNGDKYIGEINKDGEKVNSGTYEWASGERYKGDYKNDNRDGQGVYTWANGDKLDGTWVQDEIVTGTLTIPYDGVMYHSDAGHTHSDDKYKGNLQYSGAFVNHRFNGHGLAIWPNGDHYQGEWINDKINGHGIYFWSTGERYEGEWHDNKMNGAGRLYNKSEGVIQQGMWQNDVFQK